MRLKGEQGDLEVLDRSGMTVRSKKKRIKKELKKVLDFKFDEDVQSKLNKIYELMKNRDKEIAKLGIATFKNYFNGLNSFFFVITSYYMRYRASSYKLEAKKRGMPILQYTIWAEMVNRLESARQLNIHKQLRRIEYVLIKFKAINRKLKDGD